MKLTYIMMPLIFISNNAFSQNDASFKNWENFLNRNTTTPQSIPTIGLSLDGLPSPFSVTQNCGMIKIGGNFNDFKDALMKRIKQIPDEIQAAATTLISNSPSIALCWASPTLCSEIKNFSLTLDGILNEKIDICKHINSYIDDNAQGGKAQVRCYNETVKTIMQNCGSSEKCSSKAHDKATDICSDPAKFIQNAVVGTKKIANSFKTAVGDMIDWGENYINTRMDPNNNKKNEFLGLWGLATWLGGIPKIQEGIVIRDMKNTTLDFSGSIDLAIKEVYENLKRRAMNPPGSATASCGPGNRSVTCMFGEFFQFNPNSGGFRERPYYEMIDFLGTPWNGYNFYAPALAGEPYPTQNHKKDLKVLKPILAGAYVVISKNFKSKYDPNLNTHPADFMGDLKTIIKQTNLSDDPAITQGADNLLYNIAEKAVLEGIGEFENSLALLNVFMKSSSTKTACNPSATCSPEAEEPNPQDLTDDIVELLEIDVPKLTSQIKSTRKPALGSWADALEALKNMDKLRKTIISAKQNENKVNIENEINEDDAYTCTDGPTCDAADGITY